VSRQRTYYHTVDWGGRKLVPIQYIADVQGQTTSLITLIDRKEAIKLHRAGTVEIMSPDGWYNIQASKGSGLNVDPAFLRTGG